MPQLLAVVLRECRHAISEHPCDKRRPYSPVWQSEPCAEVCPAPSVPLCPKPQLGIDVCASGTRFQPNRAHHKDVSRSHAFEPQVAISRTELEKVLVGDRPMARCV